MGKASVVRRPGRPEVGRELRLGIRMLPVFRLLLGEETVDLPPAGQRLLAFLAVHGHHAISRPHAAGTLWPDTTDGKAAANLRSTLWRIRRVVDDAIDATADSLRLAPDVEVDVLTYLDAARGQGAAPNGGPDVHARVDAFSSGLLEDWYDGWLDGHRERWRLTRLCALEAIALEATQHGSYAVAVEAAFAAIRSEPLRETSHAALIEAHLAASNVSEAARHYNAYAAMLADELGLRPSRRLRSRVGDVLAAEAVTPR